MGGFSPLGRNDPTDRVTIETRATAAAFRPFACVIVQDNGRGIDERDLAHVFDPFFTTKGVGEGTGLGLSVSYGIVQDHAGSIEVSSIKGKGASFTVLLPLATSRTRAEQLAFGLHAESAPDI